jgi:hypothetical protein
MGEAKRAATIIDIDLYFRRRPINVRDEDGVFTCDTEPWATVNEFERACDLVDAFQKANRGSWTVQGYFDMLAWGETQEKHRAIARDLLDSSKRGARDE